jgi:hypothetical protein
MVNTGRGLNIVEVGSVDIGEVKVSMPIKIDRNYQNNNIAANSVQFLSTYQLLL